MSDLSLREQTEPDTAGLVQRLLHRRYLGEYADHAGARGAAEALVARESGRSRLVDVLGGAGERRGQVWLVRRGDELAVVDLTLDEAAAAGAVRVLLERLALAEGARRLTVTVSRGDVHAEGFVRDGGFEVAATQMRLDLRRRVPDEDVVALAPMDETAFDAWWVQEVVAYAAERELTGESPEQARRVSEEQHAELLPDGLATEHHRFFLGRVDGAAVGVLWIGTERPMAFVYDVAVTEEHRGRGYGAGLMRAGALWARQHGSHALGLNVFGHNHGARRLYDRLGYHVTETFVAKVLEAADVVPGAEPAS